MLKLNHKCECGHTNKDHNLTNQASWDRLNSQLEGYVERSQKDREAFWAKFLSGIVPEEFACGKHSCKCKAFRLDNLMYLEELVNESN